MPPFIQEISPPASRTTTLVDDAPSQSPFAKAIDDFITDLRKKDDTKNPFLRELHTGHQNLVKANDGKAQSQVCATDLRRFVEQLESQKRVGRGQRMLSRVSPFLESFVKLMAACENIAQASPFGVSIAFSGVRVVLELAVKLNTYLATIIDALDEIGVNLRVYEKFADAYQASEDIQQLLVSSYKKIIEFWCDVSHTLCQHTIRTVFKSIAKPLDKDIKAALDGLRQDGNKVRALAQATEAQKTRHDREASKRNGVVKWIMSDQQVDVRMDLKDQVDRRQQGTCQWLFDNPHFQGWRDSTENSVLWYNAPPGSGKSVLAATIVEYLVSRGDKVSYFFFSFNNPLRRHGINALRSLALQLLTLLKILPDKLVHIYETEMENHAMNLVSPHIASFAVHELLTQCDMVYVVIDGLDEVIDDTVTLLTLEHLLQGPTYGVVKWLFTSRNYTSIRNVMERCKAVEIEPDPDLLTKDIRKYFSSHITCETCINTWSEGEINFLYARMVCETLLGQGLTCEDEIQEALNKFPKGLNGYYVRALEKLATRTDEEQELARRTFLILIAAAQPLSLDELLDVLGVRRGAKDYKASRVPSVKVIEDLCSPLVVVDKASQEAQPENPFLKLCHKTVEDFFLQDPDSIKMGNTSQLRKYFVTRKAAQEEIGLNCLTYLQYHRYQRPELDLRSILAQNPVPKDHAFLRYAATFWSQHLTELLPSEFLNQEVRSFLKSPAFWTCLVVQARVVPYLFARFAARRGFLFTMGVKGSKWQGDDAFGVPLPDWLDASSEEGLQLDRSLCCFVDEWREVITSAPDGLEFCLPLRPFPVACHFTPLEKPKTVRITYLQESVEDVSLYSDIRLGRVHFLGKTLWADLQCVEKDGQHIKILGVPLFSKKSSHPLRYKRPPQMEGDWIISKPSSQADNQDSLELVSLDAKTLSMKRASEDKSVEHEVPLSFSRENLGRREGDWKVVGVQDIDADINGANLKPLQIIHATWTTATATRKAQAIPVKDVGDSENDDDSDSDSSDSESEQDEAQDAAGESDDDSDDESAKSGDDTEAETAKESSATDYESESDEGLITDCLVLYSRDNGPQWHAWPGKPRIWSRLVCSRHPSLPIVAVSHTARQLELINIEKKTKQTKHLPELADLQETPLASLRELRFSPCGRYLHFLSIAFIPDKATTIARVTVSTFNFNHEGNSDDTLLRECRARRCTYAFGETLKDMLHPLTLTTWTDAEVLIALPPLTCDPRIIKITLPQTPDLVNEGQEADCMDENAILTLREPVYFPTSTPKRNPRLMFRSGGHKGDGSSYLYLALDTLAPVDASAQEPGHHCMNHWKSSCNTEEDNKKEPSSLSLPVVLRWKIAQEDGWRKWDAEADGKASDLKRGLSVWKMLKGEFVNSERDFSVPIRSGLDWTRKGFLSCG